MSLAEIAQVIETWSAQVVDLGSHYGWVQVFENKGATMGCSNPHPHGQVWAGDWIPQIVSRETAGQRQYAQRYRQSLLVDYAKREIDLEVRVVESNRDWVLLVPYWATWPFELLLLPRRPVQRIPDLEAAERHSLAEILKRGLSRCDNLFASSFPYSMGWHGAPTDGADHPHWQLHAHFYPPLLRSATVRKFMVGYEMLAEPQRDLTAEQAAQRLRDCSTVHFRSRNC
jgi:UDPglucose--hexose-1-phosphate uridylyltransferase